MNTNVTPTASLSKPSTKGTPPSGKGQPPAEHEFQPNTQKPPSGTKAPLQLQVPPEVRRGVKAYAAEQDMTISDLFVRMWDEYRRNHP